MSIKRISRNELFSRLQLIRVIDPLTNAAYKKYAEMEWRNQINDSPHGRPWHVSFHASQFPGDDSKACARQALYRMMDIPDKEPVKRFVSAAGDSGKSIETGLVKRWDALGILLSASVDDEVQTGFVRPDEWLTGSVDAIVLPPGTNVPVPVEVKSEYHERVLEMRAGVRGPKPEHVKQLKVQIAFTREFQKEMWPDLDLCQGGFIYYLSRDHSEITAEFYFDHDERFWQAGLVKLRQWREHFENEELPERPKEWKWTEKPCDWCPFKRDACKPDHKAGVTKLSESNGIKWAKKIRPNYDYNEKRQRVQDEWNPDSEPAAAS